MIRSSNKISDKIKRNCLDDVSYDSKWDNFRAKPFFFFLSFFICTHHTELCFIPCWNIRIASHARAYVCVCVRSEDG